MPNKFTARFAHGELTLLAAAIITVLRAGAADTGDTLEAVIVTAERRSESIQEVPLSVTAISGDTLAKFSDVNFTDYAHAIPNLSFGTGSDFGITNGRTITIRGITGGRYRNGQATTSFYIDDTPVPLALDPRVLDLERIEVLRGPQGTLFGSSAMGGTVRLITKSAAPDKVSGFVDAQGFDINDGGPGYDVSGGVNLPLIPDELGMKASAYTTYKPGYFNRDYGIVTTPGYALPPGQTTGVDKHIGSDIEYGGMLTFKYTPSVLPGLDVVPMVIYQDARTNGFPLADYSPGNLVQVRPLNIEESSEDQWTFSSLTAKYKMDIGSIIASSAWFHRHTEDVEDNTEVSATYWGPTYATGLLPAEYLPSPAPSYLNLDSVTQEIRFESSFAFPVQLIAGLYYQHGKSHTGQDITEPVLVGQPLYTYYPYIQDVPLSNNEAAEFGDLTYTVGGLELSAGVRGSILEYNKHNLWYGWINEGLTDQYAGHREHSVTPRYTIKYQFTPDYMAYASAAKGFRSGGTNSIPDQCGAGAGSYTSDSLWELRGRHERHAARRPHEPARRRLSYRLEQHSAEHSAALHLQRDGKRRHRHQHGRGTRSRHGAPARPEHESRIGLRQCEDHLGTRGRHRLRRRPIAQRRSQGDGLAAHRLQCPDLIRQRLHQAAIQFHGTQRQLFGHSGAGRRPAARLLQHGGRTCRRRSRCLGDLVVRQESVRRARQPGR